MYEEDTIAKCKALAAEQFSIIGSQRWFCRGRILSDSMTIKQCKIPDNFVIQIIVQETGGLTFFVENLIIYMWNYFKEIYFVAFDSDFS